MVSISNDLYETAREVFSEIAEKLYRQDENLVPEEKLHAAKELAEILAKYKILLGDVKEILEMMEKIYRTRCISEELERVSE